MKSDLPVTEPKEDYEDNPIEEVRLTVPTTDDPTLPCLTFRTWVLGTISCVLLSFLNQFFSFRQSQLSISTVCAQIVALPLGRMMAATLPTKMLRVPLTKWSFTLNPGPFNLKEHVLITMFASAGNGGVYALEIVVIMKAFYHRGMNLLVAFLLAQTTQLLGYGWAGLFRKYLVDSPYMWWPSNLVQVSLFRTLHEEEKRPKGGLSRLQFFMIVIVASFAYDLLPNYLFGSLQALSIICWIWKDSITAQQLGAGFNGLGIGSFTFDWAAISYLGSPLANPAFAIFNTLAGFILTVYVLTPIAYWTNMFESKRFPMISSNVFDYDGHHYNTSRVLNHKSFTMNYPEYESYSKIHIGIVFIFSYGFGFACLAATIVHVALFHGSSIWRLWRKTASFAHDKCGDVHSRLMKKNYEPVPQWWFLVILLLTLGLSFFTCLGFNRALQLPFWGLLLACAIAITFTLPIGVIQATTNQQPGLNIITELIIGYMYPGKPLANVTFKTYGYNSVGQALWFLQDLKLGAYMKIPPKAMFVTQLAGTVIACTATFATTWFLLTSVENICDVDKLPPGSPWTCPGTAVFYSASIIWGIVGPNRMFGRLGEYSILNYFFLVGILAPIPIWLLSRAYPKKKWIPLINMPIILGAAGGMIPVTAVHFTSWGVVGIFFNVFVYKRYKGWWARNNYILSAGLDAGTAFMGVLTFLALQMWNVSGPDWWGAPNGDHCPLAHCPTVPGVVVKGCPLIG